MALAVTEPAVARGERAPMMNNKIISLGLPPGREPGLFVGLDLGQPAAVGRTLVTGAVFLPDEAPRQRLGSKWDRRDMVRQCAWRKDGWLVTDRLPAAWRPPLPSARLLLAGAGWR